MNLNFYAKILEENTPTIIKTIDSNDVEKISKQLNFGKVFKNLGNNFNKVFKKETRKNLTNIFANKEIDDEMLSDELIKFDIDLSNLKLIKDTISDIEFNISNTKLKNLENTISKITQMLRNYFTYSNTHNEPSFNYIFPETSKIINSYFRIIKLLKDNRKFNRLIDSDVINLFINSVAINGLTPNGNNISNILETGGKNVRNSH